MCVVDVVVEHALSGIFVIILFFYKKRLFFFNIGVIYIFCLIGCWMSNLKKKTEKRKGSIWLFPVTAVVRDAAARKR